MFYTFASFAVRLVLALFTRCSVVGLERVPHDASLLVVSNHLNLIDPPVLGALFPRRIVFMAKEELFKIPLVGMVVGWYGAFSVRRGQPDRQALRRSTEILQKGGVLGVFPEGTRSKSGSMNEAYPGAALIAVMSGAQVLPVAITGTDEVRSPLSLLRRPRITVRIGEPFVVERSRTKKEGLDGATAEIMGQIALLLPPERRGFYAESVPQAGSGAVAKQ